MTKRDFLSYLHEANFKGLFIECFWNNPSTSVPYRFKIGEQKFEALEVAQKGVKVYVLKVDMIPDASIRRLVDSKLRKLSYDYLSIYVSTSNSFHHLWSVPVNSVDKRQLVTVEYQQDDQATFLLEKINLITFGLDEELSIYDVSKRVSVAFGVNSEIITKKFYRMFKDQRKLLISSIKGINNPNDCDWYASIMLNRLMFCYFLQKKGFLDNDENYLAKKLAICRNKGNDLFYGRFYKRFLRVLFQEGLNNNIKPEGFQKFYGRIPYLNGGMFEEHCIEQKYKDLDIPDSFFESLFAFFDQWHWHLDSRMTASGKDINPDVLGYIFEQYINDRAAMGAYYTKEDITGYIAKNNIIGFILNYVRKRYYVPFNNEKSEIWNVLQLGGERYIYNSALRGCDHDSINPLDYQRKLHEFADDGIALPMELWQEFFERRARILDLKNKIVSGKICSITELISSNINLRLFLEDIIRQTEDKELVRQIYNAVRSVKILDPACGSGAFLFASLNLLEPIYELCIDKMSECAWAPFFEEELSEINDKYGSNFQYFIYKNIVLRNLYGVDIMREAVETARLRLFLKMVSAVDVDPFDVNLGLDPLPDVEFNIACGNSLIGYITEDELLRDVKSVDLVAESDLIPAIKDEILTAAEEQKIFRELQFKRGDLQQDIWKQKIVLRERLERVRNLLNEYMYSLNGQQNFSSWIADVRPFHWIAEFYSIMHDFGGFDVIIGNPPYVKNSEIETVYSLQKYSTRSSGNVYTAFIERGTELSNSAGFLSYIVQLPLVCTDGMSVAQNYMRLNYKDLFFATFDDRPGKLFDQLEHIRATIFTARKEGSGVEFTTTFNRWPTEMRPILFDLLAYYKCGSISYPGAIPKIGDSTALSIAKKMTMSSHCFADRIERDGKYCVYYHNAPLYWVHAHETVPFFKNAKGKGVSSQIKVCKLNSLKDYRLLLGVLNSSLFYFWFVLFSDTRHLNQREILRFPYVDLTSDQFCRLDDAVNDLIKDYEVHKKRSKSILKTTGLVETDVYHPGASKKYIDCVDDILGDIYGLTSDELEYIKDYNYKFRMGQYLRRENA